MKNTATAKPFQRATALLMCFLLSPFHCRAVADNSGGEMVGKITGVVSAAAQDGTRLHLQDTVSAKGDLTTDDSGRLRIRLQEGSTLNVGSASHLRILKHNPLTGETLVDLPSGRLRSRVTKLHQAGGRFQILTPHATITALGTDFFLDVSPARTQVIVYSGVVVVKEGRAVDDSHPTLTLDVAAGQNVVVQGKDVSHLQLTAENVEQATIAETTVPDDVAAAAESTGSLEKTHSHLGRNVLIGVAVAAGAIGAGLAAGGGGSKSSPPAAPAPSIPTIPGH